MQSRVCARCEAGRPTKHGVARGTHQWTIGGATRRIRLAVGAWTDVQRRFFAALLVSPTRPQGDGIVCVLRWLACMLSPRLSCCVTRAYSSF